MAQMMCDCIWRPSEADSDQVTESESFGPLTMIYSSQVYSVNQRCLRSSEIRNLRLFFLSAYSIRSIEEIHSQSIGKEMQCRGEMKSLKPDSVQIVSIFEKHQRLLIFFFAQ